MMWLAHVAGLETHIDLFLEKDFYCSISFGNVFIGYTFWCWYPCIYFVWLNFIWVFTLEFEVGGYDKMESFLKTIIKSKIETTLNSSYNNVF